jgi:hypothetical protein
MANAASLLKKAAKAAPPAPKKDAAPILELPKTPEIISAIKTIVEQKQVEKTAESLRKQAEAVLRPACVDVKTKHCQEEGKFHPSVKVKAGEEGPITFVQVEKYSKIGVDKEDEIKAAFEAAYGKEAAAAAYDKCVITDTEITLTEKGLKLIETLLPLLMEAADKATGTKDSWTEIFEVAQNLKPTNFLHANQMLDPKLAQVYRKLVDDGVIKPQTPHFVA